jgi:iron(III) transport system substrate-binding protein
VPEEVAKHYPPEHRDPDGLFASYRVYLCVMARNTDLVKAEDAPKSFRDLLDPKWAGKIVKAHPGYSGTILTATYQTARDVGWDYYAKLAKQRVMQVQSASDPPKKLALGERAIMADGIEYGIFQLKEDGKPVDVIYPAEGTPVATSPSAVFKAAPNPNAARLFLNWMHSREGQQILIDWARQYSAHKQAVEKPGVRKLSDIKLMKEDPEGVEKGADEIKRRYAQIFKV